MDSLFGLGGGARRRPIAPSSPVLEPNIYRWHPSNTTPQPGRISPDNTLFSSVTHLYVSTKGDDGQDNTNWLGEICANMYDVSVESIDDAASYAQFRVTAVTAGTDSYDFTVTYLAGSGDLPGDSPVFFEILPVPNAILTAKGDLLTRSSTTPVKRAVGTDGQVLVADSSQSSGLNWLTGAAFWFGTGGDSSSTLGSNTALADNLSYCRNYTTLDLSTFTLKGFSGTTSSFDRSSVYCISVLLTGSGGSILPAIGAAVVGGAAVVRGGSSGAGGTGGAPAGGLYVYARKVSGTVTINGAGAAGGIGGNGSGVPTGTGAGNNGVNTGQETYFMTLTQSVGSSVSAGGGGAAGGSAGGAGAANNGGEHQVTYYDTIRFFTAIRESVIDTETVGTRWNRVAYTGSAPSGASGGIHNSTSASGGGGGAGSFAATGTAAGTAGAAGGAGGGTIGAGGGGGGAGAGGALVGVMVGEFASGAIFTVSSNGGDGGGGGDGAGTNGGGGGGAAGGSGGIVMCVFPVAYATTATVSVTSNGGTKGAKGNKAGLGTDGSTPAANGNAGFTAIMTWFG